MRLVSLRLVSPRFTRSDAAWRSPPRGRFALMGSSTGTCPPRSSSPRRRAPWALRAAGTPCKKSPTSCCRRRRTLAAAPGLVAQGGAAKQGDDRGSARRVGAAQTRDDRVHARHGLSRSRRARPRQHPGAPSTPRLEACVAIAGASANLGPPALRRGAAPPCIRAASTGPAPVGRVAPPSTRPPRRSKRPAGRSTTSEASAHEGRGFRRAPGLRRRRASQQ